MELARRQRKEEGRGWAGGARKDGAYQGFSLTQNPGELVREGGSGWVRLDGKGGVE